VLRLQQPCRGFPLLCGPARVRIPCGFDVTHSVQSPGGQGDRSGGDACFIPHLARAGAAAGVDGFFMEVHDDPERALSDGPNSLRLALLEQLVREILEISACVRRMA